MRPFPKVCFLENMSVNIGTFVDKHWHLLLQSSIIQNLSDAHAQTSVYVSSHHMYTDTGGHSAQLYFCRQNHDCCDI